LVKDVDEILEEGAFLEGRLHLIDESEGGLNVLETGVGKVDE
jgi:hypothetical protein